MQAERKPWWRSRTLWINGLIATLLLAQDNIESLQAILPDSLKKWTLFSLPIVNLWLRVMTSHGLSFKPQMPQEAKEPE